LAFKTLLYLAPLLAVLFSILKAFGVHNRMEPVLAEALAPLGAKGKEISAHLIGFVDKLSAGALGAVGFVALFITVLSLIGSVDEAFNRICRVKAPRMLTGKFSFCFGCTSAGQSCYSARKSLTRISTFIFFQGDR
jgi:membrane protein